MSISLGFLEETLKERYHNFYWISGYKIDVSLFAGVIFVGE